MGAVVRDVRHAVRRLARTPGFTGVALVTLAVGIGACVAIFSVFDRVLLRPLPYPQPERLVALGETISPLVPGTFVRPGIYDEWRRQARSFQGLAAIREGAYNLTGLGEPVRVAAGRLTANAFATLQVRPVLGRDFRPEEDLPGKGNVVILSHGFWRRHLGGNPDVLSRTLRLDGQSYTIIGVMPAGFQLDRPLDVYVPVAYAGDPRMHTTHSIAVLGRLKAGVTVQHARDEVAAIARAQAIRQPRACRDCGVRLSPLLEARVADARPVLWALLGAVGFLLLMACANVASLLLARGTVRAREVAVRAALGASRADIVRQMLTDSLVLALAGSLVGVLFAQAGVRGLITFVPDNLPRAEAVAIDARVLAFTLALALATTLVFGLVPALRASRVDLSRTLKVDGRGPGQGIPGQRLRGWLMIGQVAIALVLLAGAGLMARSFSRLRQVDPGFQPQGAVTVNVWLAPERYRERAQVAAFARDAVARLAALPGVQAAGATQALPLSVHLNLVNFGISGRPAPENLRTTHILYVTPDYFRAMGMTLLRGRHFDGRDVAGAPRVAVINQSLARRFFPGEDPVGKRIGRADRPDDPEYSGVIVGVVADVPGDRLESDVPAQTYLPLAQETSNALTLVVRAPGTPSALFAGIRDAIHAVDPEQAVTNLRPLGDVVSRALARQRFAAFLFAVFSGAALLLAALGIYGLTAYSVAQRTGEFGIRLALGAQAHDVRRLVLQQLGRRVGLGLAIGLPAALLLTRLLDRLLYGISPHDPLTFAAVPTILILVSILACLLPIRSATRIDPMLAMRGD